MKILAVTLACGIPITTESCVILHIGIFRNSTCRNSYKPFGSCHYLKKVVIEVLSLLFVYHYFRMY